MSYCWTSEIILVAVLLWVHGDSKPFPNSLVGSPSPATSGVVSGLYEVRTSFTFLRHPVPHECRVVVLPDRTAETPLGAVPMPTRGQMTPGRWDGGVREMIRVVVTFVEGLCALTRRRDLPLLRILTCHLSYVTP